MVFKAHYFPNGDFHSTELGNYPSFVWRSIMVAQSIIREGHRWEVGNGLSLGERLGRAESCVSALRFHAFFFLFFSLHVNSKITVQGTKNTIHALFTHCSRTVHVLFTGPTTLFTYLKIILLQCF